MAKRKRLEMPAETVSADLETKSAFSTRVRMPIADVAGDTAGRAALEEVAAEMTAAEGEGRVIKKLPLAEVDIHHLNRDRLVIDEAEMESLKASLAERGQQTPVEVLRIGGRYGLISGLRRVLALKALGQDEVLALVRRPESAEAAYVAMVEENEIRAPLSYYERANLAVTATNSGVYPTPKRAISGLFAHVSSAKRSKISRFVILREALGKSLRFPAAIPEKLGLDLAHAIEADKGLARRISEALRSAAPEDAAAERRVLERVLRPRATGPDTRAGALREIAPDVFLKASKGRVALSGKGVDEALVEALSVWLVSRAKTSQPKS